MEISINKTTGSYSQKYTQNYAKQQSFKGYDARPLKAVVMTICDAKGKSFDIIKQMSEIGQKEGFRVYFTNQTNKLYANLDCIKNFFKIGTFSFSKWAQDNAVLTPDNRVFRNWNYLESSFAKRIASVTKAKISDCERSIEGGNLFFVKNGDKNELFIGADELITRIPEFLQKSYGVSKVIPIPQADFHLDLFIRPLNDKKVLVADDRLTIKELKHAVKSIDKYKSGNPCTIEELKTLGNVQKRLLGVLKTFERDVKNLKNPQADDVAKVLTNNGYTPIFVPGRIFYSVRNKNKDDLVHGLNYMNSVVHQKPDGSLVFITNKSDYNIIRGITGDISQKIDFDFEKMLIKSLKPYIKEQNIYFVEGKNNRIAEILQDEGGGIHCLCNEIPAGIGR